MAKSRPELKKLDGKVTGSRLCQFVQKPKAKPQDLKTSFMASCGQNWITESRIDGQVNCSCWLWFDWQGQLLLALVETLAIIINSINTWFMARSSSALGCYKSRNAVTEIVICHVTSHWLIDSLMIAPIQIGSGSLTWLCNLGMS